MVPGCLKFQWAKQELAQDHRSNLSSGGSFPYPKIDPPGALTASPYKYSAWKGKNVLFWMEKSCFQLENNLLEGEVAILLPIVQKLQFWAEKGQKSQFLLL